MNCEHELILTDESWISEDEVEVIAECSLCKIKFKGIIIAERR
jgi:hypothetical protein